MTLDRCDARVDSKTMARGRYLVRSALVMLLLGAFGLPGCLADDLDANGSERAVTQGGETNAILVGDPYRARFPSDSPRHNTARAINDMVVHEGRLLTGAGDWIGNGGPVDIFALIPGEPASFERVFTVADEMVHHFRVIDGKIWLPGWDARGSWQYGNYYTCRNGVWQMYRNIPQGVHVYDIAAAQGALFAFTSDEHGAEHLLTSKDNGSSWTSPGKKAPKGPLFVLNGELLVFDAKGQTSLFRYDGSQFKKLRLRVFGRSHVKGRPYRMVQYGSGLLYSAVDYPVLDTPSPLFHLGTLQADAEVIGGFGEYGDAGVRDIVVRGTTAYVLATPPAPTPSGEYIAYIYASDDLVSWQQRARFTVPAPPYSFERLGQAFYVGLGTDGYFNDNDSAASGTIWRVDDPEPTPQ